MAASRPVERIAYVDGLRGVAIGMVLVYHAWSYHVVNPFAYILTQSGPPLDRVISRGYEGVSLFLILSGFCLAHPLLVRRNAGEARWFQPGEFFARRCLRILPPYYVALTLYVLYGRLRASMHWPGLSAIGRPAYSTNVLARLLLVHNVTRYRVAINPAFWSLGLEWQWYWAFPLLLALYVWSPRGALAACALAAVLWHAGVPNDPWSISGVVSGALPPRLFEFCCGIAAAGLIARRRVPAPALLALGVVLPLLLVEMPAWPIIGALHGLAISLGLAQPLYGIAFAALLLLGHRSKAVGATLSWRPLVWLGMVSYSVYLVHQPIVNAVDVLAPAGLRASPLVVPIAIACGVAIGTIFHTLIERPCTSRTARRYVVPGLTRLFRWTDAAWTQGAEMARLLRVNGRARGQS